MKAKAAAVTLLITAISLVGLMGGTASGKAKPVIGKVYVERSSENPSQPGQPGVGINRTGPDTATYYGFVAFEKTIPLIASRPIKKPNKGAGKSAAKRKRRRANVQQQEEAVRQAEELCLGHTARTFLEVIHLSTPEYLIGRVFPVNRSYLLMGEAAPSGDLVRVRQSGTDFGADDIIRTGPFTWSVLCSQVESTVVMP
jgi:hypothetical protein